MWNGGRRQETHGLWWCDNVDIVNQVAISLWPELAGGWPCCRDAMGSMGCQDNVDGSRTPKGRPYQGFATLGDGQASVNIFVNQITRCHVPGFGAQLVKRALQSRGLSKAGSKDELSRRLADYILYPSCDDNVHTSWKWKHSPEKGVEIYTAMSFTAARHCTQAPHTKEVVQASEERVGSDGVRFLRLADGSGWLPTADHAGQILLVREDAKHTCVKVQELAQWSQEYLRSAVMDRKMNPYLAVEAYVESVKNGERRELPWPAKHPPWQTDVRDMAFPLALTFIEPGKPDPAHNADMITQSEPVMTPMKKHTMPSQDLGSVSQKAVLPSKRRRLRQKTAVPERL